MSVSRAQAEIDSDEFAHWIAFERMSPNINERLAVHFGHLIWRMLGLVSKKPGKLSEYVLDLENCGKEKTESENNVVVKLKSIQAMFPKNFKQSEKTKKKDGVKCP